MKEDESDVCDRTSNSVTITGDSSSSTDNRNLEETLEETTPNIVKPNAADDTPGEIYQNPKEGRCAEDFTKSKITKEFVLMKIITMV